MPSRAVGLRRRRLVRVINVLCLLTLFLGAFLFHRHEALAWRLWFASWFMTATTPLCLALVFRGRALWERGDGVPKCMKCAYPVERDYAACPECGLALTPEKVEASRYVWMDTRRFTTMLVVAAIGSIGAFMMLRMVLRTM